MKEFINDYHNMQNVALNKEVERFPLYDHKVDTCIMEEIMNHKFKDLINGDSKDKDEFFRWYCKFYKDMGYDTVSYEEIIGEAMPGSGALGAHNPGAIHTREDFDVYPWDTVVDNYFNMFGENFAALKRNLPDGMKAIGGAGYGIFECVQDVTSYTHLCYMMYEDPELFREMFTTVGATNLAIWKRLLKEYGDAYTVCRFGDDLGYKSNTLISDVDIKENIIPQYAKIVSEIHKNNKPFLLHSCGCIFSVMDDLISVAKIDSKHSNEDQIAPFEGWVERYGDKIGNFGGIDMNAVIYLDRKDMTEYITRVTDYSRHGHGGFAFGSGNSIPDYVPADQYVMMNEIARKLRGDFN